MISSSKQDSLPPLHYNVIIINSQNEKADLFNRYFESQIQLDDKGKNVLLLDPPVNTLDTIWSTTDEVCSILKTLPTGKACGPDLINNRILRETAESISEPLAKLFNRSLEISIVPNI